MEGLIEFGTSQSSISSVPRRSRRSKGCLTCRKRKVKCDEARPICERCHNGFHNCLGYDEPRIFVNSGPGLDRRKSLLSTHTRSPSATLQLKGNATSASALCAQTALAVTSNSNMALHNFSALNPMESLRIPPTIKLDGFRDGIVIAHLLLKFQAIVEGNTPGSTDAPTFSGVFTAGGRDSTAYISGLSVAEALFGRLHCDETLIQHSAVLYGRGLGRLRNDLQNMGQEVVRARSYMNLWSSTFLGMYEMMTASTPMSWLEHSRGLSALIQSLGPFAFQNASARRLFYSNRLFIATAGIATKRRTFLEEAEWKTVPWAKLDTIPRPVTILLQDIFCDMPGFMEDAMRLASRSDNCMKSAAELDELRAKIVSAYMETDLLRWSWEEEYPNVCWEVPVKAGIEDAAVDSSLLPFTSVPHFSSFDRAVDAIYFNVIRLLLCEVAEDVGLSCDALLGTCGTHATSSGPFSNAMLPPGQGGTEDFALEICRTVQYLVHGETDSLGSLVLMFPLRVASHHLQNHPNVVRWLGLVLSKLTARKGFKLGEFVMEMTVTK